MEFQINGWLVNKICIYKGGEKVGKWKKKNEK